MRLSRFFIDRPIFAAVLAVIITIVGAVAYIGLPVSQYPDIVPPTVTVTASYPGASAETVADTVAAPIEQKINRSEEHTSELQSLMRNPYAVFCWKKKKTDKHRKSTILYTQ